MGNLRSVQKAFEKNGAYPRVTSSATEIAKAEKIVLPGVGAFTAAVMELEKRKLMGVVRKRIDAGVPYLGLCLGLQLLFSESEESEGKKKAQGLGLIPGRVKRFRGRMKIPHMGWNNVRSMKKNCPLFKGLSERDYFYFVHSYYGSPVDASWRAGETRYGIDFCSAVWKDNVFATQFHPEKSQAAGLKLIQNFIHWTC
ncbi:MAG: imidazole glycerol phosphate synthase subunit HisH [Candidatus Omnitrophica bacterium]|nr:imidazole glycerol phosphate synthase subunit HisH [Candidatus Omnitrophota bacterium]